MNFYINTETQEYPVMEAQIKALYKNSSFPKPFKAPAPFQLVVQTPPPALGILEKAIDTKSPELVEGVYYQRWQIVDKYNTYTDEEGVVHTKEELEAMAINKYKQTKLDALATLRYQKEIAGITFNGMTIPTDRQSQAMLTGVYNVVQQNPDRLINWKTDSGFIQLNKATIEALSIAVADHIQACFDNEMTLAAKIELDIDTDIEVGWPE